MVLKSVQIVVDKGTNVEPVSCVTNTIATRHVRGKSGYLQAHVLPSAKMSYFGFVKLKPKKLCRSGSSRAKISDFLSSHERIAGTLANI